MILVFVNVEVKYILINIISFNFLGSMERMGMDKRLNLCSLILKFQTFVLESLKMSRKKLNVVLIPRSSKCYKC